ncbi:hypothetical protein [Streptomyces sp. NPDC057552]|uniref:hypothetical protein n=1 Tax=Streptomyces sp. NPDC057552 TaxID=3350537 RepID=UPI0036B2BD27
MPAGEDRKGRTRRTGQPGGSDGEEAGPVRIEAGVARGLLVPGPADEVWRKVPLALRQDLSVAAHRLVSPEQPVLREKENRSVRYALRAADGMRLGGKHWLALLGAPRESFGSARSERAGRVFEVLEQVVAEYVAPVVAGTTAPAQDEAAAPERAAALGAVDELDVSGAGPGDGNDAVAPQDAAVEGSAAAPEPGEAELEPADDAPSEPADSSPTSTSASASSGSVVETGAAEGRLLAGADDQVWGEVPLHLRQSLRGIARQLVTPVRGALREPEQRRVLSAVRAAERMKLSGAHWVLLMTTGREAFGGSGSAMAGAFYKALEQVLAEFPPLTRPQDDSAPDGAPASVGAGG